MLPVEDADEYPDDVFVMAENPTTGRNERVRHNKGSFVFRLSGATGSAPPATTRPRC
ncbi:MAG: hypothetical protein IPH38_09125 [Candidatus Microthrix sp.]|nr:hypothetical protein [Candidatus Microthrix sp.]MBK7019736.1 hypothetical protein [Candidatus Microthrix sp.]